MSFFHFYKIVAYLLTFFVEKYHIKAWIITDFLLLFWYIYNIFIVDIWLTLDNFKNILGSCYFQKYKKKFILIKLSPISVKTIW